MYMLFLIIIVVTNDWSRLVKIGQDWEWNTRVHRNLLVLLVHAKCFHNVTRMNM